MLTRLKRDLKPERTEALRAAGLAQALFGDTLCANTLMLGYAWQKGWCRCPTRRSSGLSS